MTAPGESLAFPDGDENEEFRAFLNSDRSEEGLTVQQVVEKRARRYLEIQSKLEKLFAWRGCHEAEEMARSVLDRAQQKWTEKKAIRRFDHQGDTESGRLRVQLRSIHVSGVAGGANAQTPA